VLRRWKGLEELLPSRAAAVIQMVQMSVIGVLNEAEQRHPTPPLHQGSCLELHLPAPQMWGATLAQAQQIQKGQQKRTLQWRHQSQEGMQEALQLREQSQEGILLP
jgi:hypothetical protein